MADVGVDRESRNVHHMAANVVIKREKEDTGILTVGDKLVHWIYWELWGIK